MFKPGRIACAASIMIAPLATAQMTESFKLIASEGIAGDEFGWSVAVDGTVAVVGMPFVNDRLDWQGAAYVYDTGTGAELLRLVPDDFTLGDWIGQAVAVDGGVAIIGGNKLRRIPSDPGFWTHWGNAYLFDTVTGTQLFKLKPGDDAAYPFGSRFGSAVDIDGDLAVVGLSCSFDGTTYCVGAVYVFRVSTGEQVFKLEADDGVVDTFFAESVGLSGTTIIVGAARDWTNGERAGAAYIFDAVTGAQRFKLLPDDPAPGDNFGRAVAISGTTAVVGAFGDDDLGSASGAVYLFDTRTGEQIRKIVAADGQAGDRFGRAVAIEGTTAIVGAFLDDDNGNLSGSAYLFDAATGEQLGKCVASDGVAADHFGRAVAIGGGAGQTVAIVGARYHDDAGDNAGAAYLFEVAACTADFNKDGLVDFFDLQGFLNLFAAGDLQADLNGDGSLDVFDIEAFLNLFAAGCG
jgi:FG-GAP repeat protein